MKYFQEDFFCILFLIMFMVSCSNDEEQFEGVDFDTSGMVLNRNGVTSYYGEVPSAGGVVTFMAKGKKKENGFLSQVRAGDFFLEVPMVENLQLPYTVCNEEWGRIELTSSSPYVTRVTLHENKENRDRNIELTFGGGYVISNVVIRQKGI